MTDKNCDWHSAPGFMFGIGTKCSACGDGFGQQQVRVADEHIRIDRWHATYNAALSGCHGWCDHEGVGLSNEVAHEAATEAANLAHGPLVKP